MIGILVYCMFLCLIVLRSIFNKSTIFNFTACRRIFPAKQPTKRKPERTHRDQK